MAYPVRFWTEVFVAIAFGVSSIAYLRSWRTKRLAADKVSATLVVGLELARAVAPYLRSGLVITYHHKEWCGYGLRYAEGKYIYGGSHDGEILTPTDLAQSGWNVPERREFETEDEFVAWLASQTNASLARHDSTQPLTRERLVNAVQYCLTSDQPNWAHYAG